MIALDKKKSFVCDISMRFLWEPLSSLSVRPLKSESFISVRLQSTRGKKYKVSVREHSLTLHNIFVLCAMREEELKEGSITFVTATGSERVKLKRVHSYW